MSTLDVSLLTDILLLRSKRITFCVMCGYAFWIALKVRTIGPRNAFWGVSFLRTLLGAFGGGIMVPLCMGKPPGPMANDMVVSAALVAWYLAQRSPGDVVWTIFGPKGSTSARLMVLLTFELFRANFIISMTELGMATLKPAGSALFSMPLWGPLLCGAMGGSFGNFLPWDKGLSPIESGFSWPMISAFAIAAANVTLLHEPTLGPLIWSTAAPTLSASVETVRVCAVAFLWSVAVLQETVMGATWHPLKPLTTILSAIVPPVVDDVPVKAKSS